ncbi:DUF4230 domain-containing protein [Candidatus Eisenbacteria bacterium]|uniref:DUF4230 domain-containing protein n=1 Tax=Eiseniibacteriota bacterium TaxID=2212470 RepID=A0ABV6YJI0_UNCEI
MSSILLVLMLLLLIVVVVVVGFYILRRKPAAEISIHSSIQHIRSIGQLSVFKVITKEIVTETDHSWGSFGSKYLSWVLSKKKMAMIFEFEIDFRYDLRRPDFTIVEMRPETYLVTLPPCMYQAHIRDIRFYDEQKSRLLPWLLPDLLSGFLLDGFSEEHKNKLVSAAKSHAEEQARQLITSLESEVQASAKATLQSISKAFGVVTVEFQFLQEDRPDLTVAYDKALSA